MDLDKLVRSNIKRLKPYSSARDEFQGDKNAIVFLDANENPFETGLNRYPDPQQLKLKSILVKQKNVNAKNILLGNGSDEVLDLIIRAFCEPKVDSIITLPPTYGMYKVLADINAVDVIQIQLTDDFQPNVNAILKEDNPSTKLLFLCSPNNPTSNSFDAKKVEIVLEKFSGIVVIDEAYIDFSNQESWVNRLDEFPNLIVTQTLSKAYGLAGIRLGICCASAEIISVLNSIKPPYNVNQLTQQKAIEILSDTNKVDLEIKQLMASREELEKRLKSVTSVEEIYPSDANFLLVKVDDANTRYNQLIEKGIVVRNRSNQVLCENCLRFTVGTKEENDKLIEALSQLKNKKSYPYARAVNMKKVLFIDRDGTIIRETADEQIDSFEKLVFYPKVFQYLSRIAKELDFEIVMITNQDGLGTPDFPEDTFWPVHNFIIDTFKNEGIVFKEQFIDKTYAKDNAPTRKPNTGLLTQYFSEAYDLENSFVIGDRLTDVELAKNLGGKGIYINDKTFLGTDEITVKREELDSYIALETNDWQAIYKFLSQQDRQATIVRNTNETKINIALNLDGTGKNKIDTGLAFFDHMLEQIARHGQLDLDIKVNGDLEVDEHHTIEDTAIALGEVFSSALGNKLGIERYGFCLPMDDCLAQVAIDFGGRNWLVWEADFKREKIGEMPTEMFMHFFKSFTDGAKANLNIKAEGTNEHHKIEAIFKAFAKAIKMAVKQDKDKLILPTTKGLL